LIQYYSIEKKLPMIHDHEIWDEFKWEEFMKKQDKRVERYMELFYRYHDDPDRDEIIAREMGWKGIPGNFYADEHQSSMESEEWQDGEEWKAAVGFESDEHLEVQHYKHLPVYRLAHEFALKAFYIAEQLSDSVSKDSAVVDFVSGAMITSARIAGGTGLGSDMEELGGNIAFCKRGLAAANLAITALREMMEKKIIGDSSYRELLEEAAEVRNAIAIHILELREKFRRGV
jgi:hypothetical protein